MNFTLGAICISKYHAKIIRFFDIFFFPGIIQIETKLFALCIDSLTHDHREFLRHCSIYTRLSQNKCCSAGEIPGDRA